MSASKTPLLTILLPTKGRHFLLPYALSSLLNQSFKDFEVIFIDNDDTTKTAEIFHGPIWGSLDSRFRYVRTGGLWMTENFEVGLNMARGKYFWLMEDKAFVVNDGLQMIVDALEKSQAQALSFDLANHEVGPELTITDTPILVHNYPLAQEIQAPYTIRTADVMQDFFNHGFVGLIRAPRTINSVVSMQVVNQIRHRTGSFYKHPDPDVTSVCMQLDILDEFHKMDNRPVSFAMANAQTSNAKLSNGMKFRTSFKDAIECLQYVPSQKLQDMEKMPIGAFPLFHNMIFFDYMNVRRLACGNILQHKLRADQYFRVMLNDLAELEQMDEKVNMVRDRVLRIQQNYPHEYLQLEWQ